ncbi:MAG: hypothetical protein Q7I97_06325 [Thermovirgaceae bacterium]|nr:hypothetical protein [Thermovirgaceae bacterium]
MLYFQFLALFFGTVMLTVAPFVAMRGERWIDFLREVVYPEEQPVWFWVAGAASVFLVLVTWYAELTTSVHLSWVMTLYITLAIPKFYLLLFRYRQTRKIMVSLMDRGRVFSLGLAGFVYCMGFAIICLGIFAF